MKSKRAANFLIEFVTTFRFYRTIVFTQQKTFALVLSCDRVRRVERVEVRDIKRGNALYVVFVGCVALPRTLCSRTTSACVDKPHTLRNCVFDQRALYRHRHGFFRSLELLEPGFVGMMVTDTAFMCNETITPNTIRQTNLTTRAWRRWCSR